MKNIKVICPLCGDRLQFTTVEQVKQKYDIIINTDGDYETTNVATEDGIDFNEYFWCKGCNTSFNGNLHTGVGDVL